MAKSADERLRRIHIVAMPSVNTHTHTHKCMVEILSTKFIQSITQNDCIVNAKEKKTCRGNRALTGSQNNNNNKHTHSLNLIIHSPIHWT